MYYKYVMNVIAMTCISCCLYVSQFYFGASSIFKRLYKDNVLQLVHMRLTTSPLFVTVMCLGSDITEEATKLTVSDKNYSKISVSFNSDVIILTILAGFSK